MTAELFIKSIVRANQYRIEDIATIERIAWLYIQEGYIEPDDRGALPAAELDADLTGREAYQEGFLTETPDLSAYDDNDSDSDSDSENHPDTDSET